MDEILVPRPTYQSLLMRTASSPMIKVLVGMRRTGKSTLMRLFIKDLLSSGVDPSRIYYRKFDDELAEERPDLRGMIDDVKSRIEAGRGSFVLLDEMQDIEGWERAVESFYEAGADVYITGSNATMLSSQLASGLSGRYVEIAVYPLTFAEFVEFRRSRGDASDEEALMRRFQQTGSLPAVALMNEDDTDLIEMMLSGIFSTVFVKDVVQRNEIRNSAKIYNLNRFMMRNIGDRVSVRSAAGYLTSTSSKTNPETVDSYIGMLEAAMLFYRAKRMDSGTKDYLRTSEKFYSTDIGIRNALVPSRPEDVDGVMENIVFMELKKRYGTVCTYDVNGREVDFAVWTPRYKAYYQVCADITSPDTLKRELAPLRAINDNYPKFIICKGRAMHDEVDGIRIVDYDGWVKEPYRPEWTGRSHREDDVRPLLLPPGAPGIEEQAGMNDAEIGLLLERISKRGARHPHPAATMTTMISDCTATALCRRRPLPSLLAVGIALFIYSEITELNSGFSGTRRWMIRARCGNGSK